MIPGLTLNPDATPAEAPLIEIKNLTVTYTTRAGRSKAVDDVSFTINKGEALGLAGESGCGKTTVALSLIRLLGSNARIDGQIMFNGTDMLKMGQDEIRNLRWKQISMIPQGSMNSLDPVIPIGNQIIESIVAHERLPRREAWALTDELLSSVAIHPSRARNYPHEFSGGMRQRAVIAMALALNPLLVIADEPTTALDVVVQKQLLILLKQLQRRLGVSFLFITHDLSVISEIADRIAIMYAGKIVEIGMKDDVLKHPSHPYTEALVNSVPKVFGERQILSSIPGSPPSGNWTTGCRFHPRCKHAFELCLQKEPKLMKARKDTMAACHLVSTDV